MARKPKLNMPSKILRTSGGNLETLLEEYTSRLEVQVAQESRFYRLMADAMPQIVWMAGTDGTTDYFNRRWYEFTGLDEAASLRQGWLAIVHPDDLKKTKQLWEVSQKNGSLFETEARFATSDKNTYRWFLIRALPGLGTNRRIIKWFGTCTDIDEQKRTQANKDEFIAITSHELKTPLTSLKAFNQVIELQMKKLKNADALDIVDKMNSQIDRLNGLINDLLDISLLDTGKLRFRKQNLDFDEFVYSTIENLRLIIPSHKISIEGRTGKSIRGDRNRLEQIIINLISNAAKYSPKAKQIQVKLEANNNFVTLHVKDCGLGIPKNEQQNIFQRFYRVQHPAYAMSSGFGLGLYISNEILKNHNGRLWVESQLGKGSTFSFSLPASSRTIAKT